MQEKEWPLFRYSPFSSSYGQRLCLANTRSERERERASESAYGDGRLYPLVRYYTQSKQAGGLLFATTVPMDGGRFVAARCCCCCCCTAAVVVACHCCCCCCHRPFPPPPISFGSADARARPFGHLYIRRKGKEGSGPLSSSSSVLRPRWRPPRSEAAGIKTRSQSLRWCRWKKRRRFEQAHNC